jgi:AI-2 transport protein TqsA
MADDQNGGRLSSTNATGVLQMLALLTIIIAGMKMAASLYIPVLIAIVLSLVCQVFVRKLQSWNFPKGLAIGLVLLIFGLITFIVAGYIGASIGEFQRRIPDYSAQLQELFGEQFREIREFINEKTGGSLRKVNPGATSNEIFDFERLLSLIASAASSVLSLLSDFFVVFLLMLFLLLELDQLPTKLRMALGAPEAQLSTFTKATHLVNQYMFVKTTVSLFTGMLVYLLALIAGIDFPGLLGLIAFLFNFIPNIGSLIAAAPGVLLALVQLGWGGGMGVLIGYLVINQVMGNFVEPRVLGKTVGLSTFVVFFSLLFWSWVLGPVGMLLSIPLTVVLKIWFENTNELKVVGLMLGPACPDSK